MEGSFLIDDVVSSTRVVLNNDHFSFRLTAQGKQGQRSYDGLRFVFPALALVTSGHISSGFGYFRSLSVHFDAR